MATLESFGFVPPSVDELAALEADICEELANPERNGLRLLGYGEVTIALAYPREQARLACKRLPPSRDLAALEHYRRLIEAYVAELRAAGVKVIPTATHLIPSRRGRQALLITQPILPAECLGPSVLRQRMPDADDPFLNAILATSRALSPRLGIDSQLSNWALIEDEPWQIDISSPFLRKPDGNPELDGRVLVLPYPAPIRPFLRHFVVPGLLKRYHDPRATILDFIGNLYKEKLDQWVEPAIAASSRFLDRPPSLEEAQAYYKDDARLWETVYRLKRISRSMTRLTGGTYQFLLPPPTAR